MAEDHHVRIRQVKTFRPRKDTLGIYNDEELIKRYRLDRAGILYVTDLVRERIQSATGRSMAITPEMKVLVMLRYLATGKMQLCNGDDLGLSQPGISRVISETLDALSTNDMLRRFVKFPREIRDIQRKQREFMQIANMPGVVGAIDGTHIRIVVLMPNTK